MTSLTEKKVQTRINKHEFIFSRIKKARSRGRKCHAKTMKWSGYLSVSGDLLDKSPGGVKLGVEGEKRFAPRVTVGRVGDMKDTEPGVSYTFVPVYM